MNMFFASFQEKHKDSHSPKIKVFVDQYVIDKLTQLQIDHDVCIELPELFENTGIEAQRKIDFIVTLGGDGTILWASK